MTNLISDTAYDTLTSRVKHFEAISVVPYSELLDSPRGRSDHCGGPCFPSFKNETWTRHVRYGRSVDAEPTAPGSAQRLAGSYVWSGPLVHHFGHQIADFSQRLLPGILAAPEAKFLLSTGTSSDPILNHAFRFGRFSGPSTWPRFFREMLAWYGISEDRVLLLREPKQVDELIVPAQAEQLGVPPSESYLSALQELASKNLLLETLPRRRAVYVSRSKMKLGCIAGERYLERVLSAAGVEIVHPETLPLSVQLGFYSTAAVLIFAEGSAIHGCQLLGRNLRDVIVLSRRRITRPDGRDHFLTLLKPRAASVRRFDMIEDIGGLVRPETSITTIDALRFLEELRQFGIHAREHLSMSEYLRERQADLEAFLVRQQSDPRADHPSVAENLAHLIEMVRRSPNPPAGC